MMISQFTGKKYLRVKANFCCVKRSKKGINNSQKGIALMTLHEWVTFKENSNFKKMSLRRYVYLN